MTACRTNSCTSIFSTSSCAEVAAAAGIATRSRDSRSANVQEHLTAFTLPRPHQSLNPAIAVNPLFPRWRLLLRLRVRVAQHLAQPLIAEGRWDEREH